jgi:hypothetical protein
MFLVNDSIYDREFTITQLMDIDPSMSFSLAMIHFEWSLKRIILGLGKSPSISIKKKLEAAATLSDFRSIWQKELTSKRNMCIITKVFSQWELIYEIFHYRNKYVTYTRASDSETLVKYTNALLIASRELYELGVEHKLDIYTKIPIKQMRFMKVI